MTRSYWFRGEVLAQEVDDTLYWYLEPREIQPFMHGLGDQAAVTDDLDAVYTGDEFWYRTGELFWSRSRIKKEDP